MTRYCITYHCKATFLVVLLFCSLGSYSQLKDTTGILFYSVKNVSTEWNSTQLEKTNSSEDIQKFLKQNASSSTEVKDAYLVPTILNLITESTNFVALHNFKDRKKIAGVTKKSSEHLLIISINKFGNLVEYQFHLSAYDNKSYHQIKQSSFFIDPSSQSYYNTIKREVQQIFDGPLGKNKPPNPQIRLDGQMVDKITPVVFYRSSADTIILDGTSSKDDNTPTKFLKYRWSVEKPGYEDTFIKGFSFEKSQQKLLVTDTGSYTFNLEVSDGVAWSKDTTARVTIQVINKPKLELYKNETYIIQRGIIMTKKRSFQKSRDSVAFYFSHLQRKSILKFSYVDSFTKKQKYFLDAHPEISKNQLSLRFDHATKKEASTHYAKLSGILIDTSFLSNPGRIKYRLGDNIRPGQHTFTVNSEYKGIESNKDTVSISYREKSALNFSLGFLTYDIPEGEAARISVNAFKFGFRAYLTQRISVDLEVLYPNKTSYENETVVQDSSFMITTDYSINTTAIKLNYDLFPFRFHEFISGDSFAYLTLFASYNQLLITSSIDDTEAHMLGVGIKPRMQLFKQSKEIGVLYLEGEIGYQSNLWTKEKNDGRSESFSFGISLVYGFLKF